jgi:hypothetical protein
MEEIVLPNQEPEKKHWFNDPDKIRLTAALLTIGAAAVNVFGRYEKTTWILFAGIGVLVLSFLVPVTVRKAKARSASVRNMHFVEREHKKLNRFLEKFTRMCLDRHDTRTFLYIIANFAKFQINVMEQIIGNDFITPWTACFAIQLKAPCHELKPFLARCREFCVIVKQFNEEYVIKAQKGLEASPRKSDHMLAELEAFREEFAQFLREVEEWIDGISKEANQHLTLAEQIEHGPLAHFQRAKPFILKSLDAKGAT